MVKVRDDLGGKTFNLLTVIEQTEDYISPKGYHKAQWLCECGCENRNIVIVRGEYLKDGRVQSCGCINDAKAKELGQSNKKYNRFDINGNYGIGWTNNTNNEFYFDVEDFDLVKNYCWFEYVDKNGHHSLRAWISNQGKEIAMHQILGFWGGDHKNRNPLDNRKDNLRGATRHQNAQNHPLRRDNTTGFSGVYWRKDNQKWTAMIVVDGHPKRLGCFDNKLEAIKARLNAEYQYYGIEFAPQRHLFEEYGII